MVPLLNEACTSGRCVRRRSILLEIDVNRFCIRVMPCRGVVWQHFLVQMQMEGPVASSLSCYELTKQRDCVHVLQPEAGGRVT